jgi:hypothetical protein
MNYFERLPSFSDERFFLLLLPEPQKILLWLILTWSLAIGSFAKIAMYSHIYHSKIKEQPINILILIEQVIHHVCNFFISFSICISYPFGILPGDFINLFFGNLFEKELCCLVFFNIYLINVSYLTADGLGIALVRLLYIKKGRWLKYTFGEIKLLMLTGLGIALTAITLMSMFSFANKSKRSPYLLCMGHNQNFQVINAQTLHTKLCKNKFARFIILFFLQDMLTDYASSFCSNCYRHLCHNLLF